VFVTIDHFHPTLILLEPTLVEPLTGHHCTGIS